jgi:hypothetical protein
VGIDLPDRLGHTSGLEGELVWEALGIAVVESEDNAERPLAEGWTVFEQADLLTDIEPLIVALGAAEGDR